MLEPLVNIRTVTFDRLSEDELTAWKAIQRAEPALASPYFRPEFAQIIHAVRNNVEVAVLEAAGKPVGFFPFERGWGNRGRPIGTWLSDYHGVIIRQDVELDPIALLRGCGLSSWQFNHLVCPNSSFAKYVIQTAASPYVDLSQGFNAYEESLPRHVRSEAARRRRKVEREIGPLRFEPNVRDSAVLSTLLAWKTEQYKRYYQPNHLGLHWVREMLETILERRGDDFTAIMPALYYGDKVIAIAYYLRSHNVLHSWITSYDRAAACYAPGLQLIFDVLKLAADSGVSVVDFGRGEEKYKQIFKTGETQVAEGAIDVSMLRTAFRSIWLTTGERVRTSPLSRPAKVPVRVARHIKYWLGGYS
jgi:CelD/BcsL family acetyltransferase involved in cellulose biosynthesis